MGQPQSVSGASDAVIATTVLFKPGVSKLRPVGQIRPAKPFHSAAKTLCQ